MRHEKLIVAVLIWQQAKPFLIFLLFAAAFAGLAWLGVQWVES